MKQERLTKEKVLDKMRLVFDMFIKDDKIIYYRTKLTILGLYPVKYKYWVDTKDPEIVALYNELELMQEDRIVNGMLDKKSNVNVTASIFWLKARRGWIEEEKRLQLELTNKQLELEAEVTIEFVNEEETKTNVKSLVKDNKAK